MFNKIYVKVINFIKEEYKFLIFLFVIIFLGLFQLPYYLHIGGGLVNIAKRIEIEDEFHESGSYNMAYVRSTRATIPTYLLSYIFDWERENIDVMKIDENDNPKEIWNREKLYLDEANESAIISAYTKAGEDISIKKELLKVLYVMKNSDTDLQSGDTILKIDNVEIKNFEELKRLLENYKIGEKVKVNYLRENNLKEGYFIVKEIEGSKKIGVYLAKMHEYDVKRNIKLDFSSSEGGPSGGFMLSLAIYDRLTEDDLSKGRKIAGTGTIDDKGNIGEIGGVKYKVMGAHKGGADIFFVPVNNYDEAIKFNEEKGYNLNIVKVNTLDEAIDYLRRN